MSQQQAAPSTETNIINPDIEHEIPKDVLQFLRQLNGAVLNSDIDQVFNLYEHRLNALNNLYYMNKGRKGEAGTGWRSWPAAKHAEKRKVLSPGQVTEFLYQFIYYRHLYMNPNMLNADTRRESWEVFSKLFDRIAREGDGVRGGARQGPYSSGGSFDVHNAWLWDIQDEFVYQLQTHHTKRLKMHGSFPASYWSVDQAIQKLNLLLQSSGIVEMLSESAPSSSAAAAASAATSPMTYLLVGDKDREADGYVPRGASHVRQVAGLFSIISLIRIDVSLGDYAGAIATARVLESHVDILREVPASYVSLHYHLGFSYMMLRRYPEAITAFKTALSLRAQNRQYVDQLQSQALSLLHMAATLSGITVDDSGSYVVNDRSRWLQEDDTNLMEQGDMDRFRDVFSRCCPKFIPLTEPSVGNKFTDFTGQEGKELQVHVFMREIAQQQEALKLRAYLRVYGTITKQKIAMLLEDADPTAALLSCKIKSRRLANTYGPSGSANNVSTTTAAATATTTLDFGVKGDDILVVHAAEDAAPTVKFFQGIEKLKA